VGSATNWNGWSEGITISVATWKPLTVTVSMVAVMSATAPAVTRTVGAAAKALPNVIV
jgi:hypothetical protein